MKIPQFVSVCAPVHFVLDLFFQVLSYFTLLSNCVQYV